MTELSDVDFHHEFSAAQAEYVSPVCTGLDEVRQRLLGGRSVLAEATRRHGALLVATGTPPLGRPGPPPVTDIPRYRRMVEVYGTLTEDRGVCRCHMHVGVPDLEQAAGVPPHFHSTDEHEAFVSRLASTGVILDAGMVYWYVGPSPHAPTVEVRVADVAGSVEETVLQAALTHALVTTALEVAAPLSDVPDALLRAACLRAALAGLGTGGRAAHPRASRARRAG